MKNIEFKTYQTPTQYAVEVSLPEREYASDEKLSFSMGDAEKFLKERNIGHGGATRGHGLILRNYGSDHRIGTYSFRKAKLEKKERISYSEFKMWNECSHKHKLIYIDKVDHFLGNQYLAFGTAMHKACEEGVKDPSINLENVFIKAFKKEFAKLDNIDSSIVEEFMEQGIQLCPEIFPALNKQFPEFELVSVEEELFEDIKEFESNGLKFKGFIDLVIKTPDDKYHIIDWKTCSWGWDAKRKSDKMVAYQLSFYKNYFAKKHNISLKNIETYFILLKRTAKKNKAEVIRVSNADRRIKNSLTLLERAVTNINKNISIKNKLACKRCHLYKVHCDG